MLEVEASKNFGHPLCLQSSSMLSVPITLDSRKAHGFSTLKRTPAVLRNVYVLVVVLVGWVFFRSLTLDQALDMLTRMFGLQQGSETMLSLSSNVATPTMALIIASACLSYPIWPAMRDALQRTMGGTAQQVAYGLVRAGCVGAITLLCIATMTVDQNNPFIYFRF